MSLNTFFRSSDWTGRRSRREQTFEEMLQEVMVDSSQPGFTLDEETLPAPTIEERQMDVIEKPAPIPKELTPQVPTSYFEQCKRLGFWPEDLRKYQFTKFLDDKEISLYDNEHVWKYLKKKCPRGWNINWIPLRAKDSNIRHNFVSDDGVKIAAGTVRCAPYNKLVPERVLGIVGTIQDAFPDARFFVSDIHEDPDPFLGVKFDNSNELFIVAVWDEPGFSG